MGSSSLLLELELRTSSGKIGMLGYSFGALPWVVLLYLSTSGTCVPKVNDVPLSFQSDRNHCQFLKCTDWTCFLLVWIV